MRCVLAGDKACRAVEQHRPQHEDDGILHENDELPGRKLAYVAKRQLEAVPDEQEEQHVDVLQVIPHPLWR